MEDIDYQKINESQALKDVENALRNFISMVLRKKFGENWIDNCGVSQERISKWKERREEERKRRKTGAIEERLIYYSDFFDLKEIILNNRDGEIGKALSKKKEIELFMNILNNFRDADAHRRDFFPHQKHLILGLSGEIKSRLIKYRSKQETGEDFFPRIESVKDNLGNTYESIEEGPQVCLTENNLRPGDKLEFIVTATDPKGDDLEYCIHYYLDPVSQRKWGKKNILEFEIQKKHISSSAYIQIIIKSKREYHARVNTDDDVSFQYCVLPEISEDSK